MSSNVHVRGTGKGVLYLSGVKRLYCILLGVVGIILTGITFLVILIQIRYEWNFILMLFCAASWILYFFAAVSAGRFFGSERDINYEESTD